jgi:ankyrin repeat protein
LDSLRGKKSPKAIRAALDRIVTGSDAYDGAYGDAMHRIGCQLPDEGGLAKQALMWITLVKRPLTTTELQHALAVEIGLSKLDEDNVSQIEDIVSVCAGLVTVDKERNLVRLVHYTTQEYFERNRDRWFPEAEAIITDTCVTYLSFDAFGSGICATDEEFKERMDTYALYRYATKEWGDHARAVTTLSQATKDFLAPSKSLDAAVEAFTAVEVPFPKGFLRTGHEGLTGLHLAAWFGKEELVRHAAGFCDVNARTSYGTTALEFAAVRGHRAVVEILISRDAHVHGKRKVGQSAISLAAEGGFKDIVEILLEHGADIASVDRFDRTPLLLAARRGHTDIVRLLLEKGSDVEWIDDSQGRTSLAHAARGGYNSTAEALIASGAKVEAKDFDGMTALGLAVEGGYSSTLEMLLSKGADIEALDHGRDHASRSALMRMISRQNREAVELLIRHGANIELRTEAGFTPLMLATRLGNEGIVKLLLDSGCDIDAKDKDEKTALHLAIESGRGNIVALLRAGLDGD